MISSGTRIATAADSHRYMTPLLMSSPSGRFRYGSLTKSVNSETGLKSEVASSGSDIRWLIPYPAWMQGGGQGALGGGSARSAGWGSPGQE